MMVEQRTSAFVVVACWMLLWLLSLLLVLALTFLLFVLSLTDCHMPGLVLSVYDGYQSETLLISSCWSPFPDVGMAVRP